MKTKCLILLLMMTMTMTPVCGFAQECPCIKTALIGTNASAPVAHNNSISSDRAIRQVQVTALSGSILLNRSYNGSSKQEILNVSKLEPGVYFVRIELSEHIAVLKKIIKQ